MAFKGAGSSLASRRSAQLLASRRSFANLPKPGDEFEWERIFTEEDVDTFLTVTGDNNPIHRDHDEALAAGFSGPILPGILCASMFPTIIARNFPGAVYLSQTLKFRNFAEVGSQVLARLTVEQVSRSQLKFESTVFNKEGNVIVDGYGLAMVDALNGND